MNVPTTPGTWRAALLALVVGASSSAVADPGAAKGGEGKTHVAVKGGASAKIAKKSATKEPKVRPVRQVAVDPALPMPLAAAITTAAITIWALVARWAWRAINAATITERVWRV
jgi:hypothetical protein